MESDKEFRFEDGEYLRVYIHVDTITFTLRNPNGFLVARIIWAFDSEKAMKEEMAELIERNWNWAPSGYTAISEYNYIHTREGIQLYDKRLGQVAPDVKAWLKKQFQKPKLKPESEEAIQELVKLYTRDFSIHIPSFTLHELCLKVLEIESK